MPQHRQIQTNEPKQGSIGTETSMYRDTDIQTDQIRYVNTGANTNSIGNPKAIQTDLVRSLNNGSDTMGNAISIQTDHAGTIAQTSDPAYRSQYARQIAAMDTTELQHGQQSRVIPMDTIENNQQVSLPPIAHQQPMFLAPPSNQHQIMHRNQHPIALPPIAHQQSAFVQPPAIRGPGQQHALPQSQHIHTQQQLALPPITYQQQLALPQPQQQCALPAPYQQLALLQPQHNWQLIMIQEE